METSSLPERMRLRTLALYRVLDTAAEQTFDDLTRLAAAICKAPIGLVSLVDEHRQWFKSRVGLDAPETPREVAFCSHAIESDELFVVEDATRDERFCDNPLVTGEPDIRFYAGAPLRVANGHRLGTLCVIDRKPRALDSDQQIALLTLRDAVVTQLELRRSQLEFRAVQELLPICSWCHSIRNDEDEWVEPASFFTDEMAVTHGICPTCATDPNVTS